MFAPGRNAAVGFPDLVANVGKVYGVTPVVPNTNVQTFAGGMVAGLSSVSEPNTSPDTLTVCAVLSEDSFKHVGGVLKAVGGQLFVPNGTPVLVTKNKGSGARTTHKNEPLHVIELLNDNKEVVDKCREAETFITVLVGDVTFVKNKPVYLAVAIQNVATVSLLGRVSQFKDVNIGDKVFMSCPDKSDAQSANVQKTVFSTALAPRGSSRLTGSPLPRPRRVRVLTVVAPPIGATVKCDLGEVFEWNGQIP